MSTPRSLVILFTLAGLAIPPSGARAQGPYELDRPREWAWVGGGLALCTAGALGYYRIPFRAEYPDTSLDRSRVNSFDRALMEPYHEDHMGDALLATSCALPFTLLSRSDVKEDADALALMWFEAALINQGLVFLSKAVAQRPRPYAYDVDAPENIKARRDSHLSFYSGHTSWSAMNCFYTATVFSDYSENRDAEIAVWAGAVVYAALTGYSRVNSGHHFATDVITGFVIGAAVGAIVPVLHRRDDTAPPATGASPASNSIRLGFTWGF